MTTETPATATTPTTTSEEPGGAAPIGVSTREAANISTGDEDQARRREEQWRAPQLLTALLTPILGLIAVIFNISGINTYANIAGILAIVTGTTAALIAVEMWRLHKASTGEA